MVMTKPIAEKYVDDVITRKILACKWVIKACERHRKDRSRKRFKYYFSEDAADHALDFFGFLKHSKGEWAGQPFELSPWQQFIVWSIFGWLQKSDDMRRFRTSYLEVARKNGKTTLAAGIGLYLFDGDDEPGAEVYSAATKLDQAKICHGEASRMVKGSPHLRDHIGVHINNLHNIETASKFEPVGRDHDSLDGFNLSGAIVDELHAHKTRDMWDVLDTATGSRRQALLFAITTAGFNRLSVCYEQHSYAQSVLEGSIKDDSFFCMIFTLDEDDRENWSDEKLWIKSNPNLGVSAKIADLRRKAKKAIHMPSAENAFLRLHLNIWTESETRWIKLEYWKACAHHVSEEGLKGRRCYGALDLSSNKDITAWILVFPPEVEGDRYQVLCRFFIPQMNVKDRVNRDKVPYDVWIRQGFITATPGNVIDYKHVLKQIDEDSQQFDIVELAFDRWGATKVVQDLQDMGFEKPSDNEHAQRFLIDFGQGYASMSSPTKELENFILGDQLAHGGNPVLQWMASNTVVEEDPAGNVKPSKKASTEKIDGIVALIMGIDRAVAGNDNTSVYDERGVLVF